MYNSHQEDASLRNAMMNTIRSSRIPNMLEERNGNTDWGGSVDIAAING